MPLLADRVRETSATTGTGTLTLAGAVAGYQGFNAAFANADTVYYVIQYATEWEVGIGTVGTGTLARDTVLASSNADALVPFSAGTKDVFCAYVAGRAVTTSDAATLTNKTIDDISNLVGADHIHYKIKANATITKGQTLKAVGYNAGEAAIEVVPISSASDTAVGIAYQSLASGAFGAAINTGLLIGVKTDFAGWALGDVLYPDPSTGGLTKTKPTSGLYQACAYVMRVQSNNGVLLCEFTEPQQVLASTNTANTAVLRDGSGNFAAGTITANLTGNISGTAPAGTLTGATLAAGVTASSLTSVGTLASLTVTNPITGSVTGSSGSTTGNAATATALQTARTINGVSFNGTADITVTAAAGTLSGSTLASGVTASSLTSVGTLTALTVSGNLTVDTNTLFVDAANDRVGIQTATPAYPLQVRRAGGAGSLGVSIDNAVSQRTVQYFAIGDTTADTTAHGWYTRAGTATDVLRMSVDYLGNLAVDTNTLFVDAVNNRVGVGTASPSSILHAFSPSGSAALYLQNGTATTGRTWKLDSFSDGNFFIGIPAVVDAVTVTPSGNLGLGVTPSAWGSNWKAFDQAAVGALAASASGSGDYGPAYNAYNDNTNWLYKYSGPSARYRLNESGHTWFTAPSGTAGAAISFTQAMTLDASGNLGVGVTTDLNLGLSGCRGLSIGGTALYAGMQIRSTNGNAELAIGFGSATDFFIRNNMDGPLRLGSNGLERARIPAIGGMVVGTAALATTATDGFLYVPTCAGTPTGVPTTQTGTAAIVINTTNNKLYFFSGGTWRDAGP